LSPASTIEIIKRPEGLEALQLQFFKSHCNNNYQGVVMGETTREGFRCSTCGQPLFLDKKECREFIEGKLKQGYIVCSCCGREHKTK
jgi:hypothetical protein